MIGKNFSRRHFLQGAAVAGAAAVAGPKLGWAAEGGVFRMANYGDLQVLDPAFTLAAAENAIYELIYHRLVRFRSEEHTSELQSLMRISYAVFCLKKKNNKHTTNKYV